MNFSDALASFLGRSVEIVQPNQFLLGNIIGVSEGVFTIQLESSNYIPSAQQVSVFIDSVTLVRVLP
ncbi:hypothetical protein [Paenibacillus sp. DMB20]|uniref:hypothetical protein n=1 Tax=Paenibacillus sp. DMB20 TaxID=1642570 RepID=UPI0006278F50|nr:hypothetical protein [Paenibacillus sp. DMB20]KKO55173.1 hypothetical protein XI25_02100 [Paenibacillus sp. DMB20]